MICTNQARLLTGLVDDHQYAVKDSERQKRRKHLEACADRQLCFIPMAVDAWGTWGEESEAAFEQSAKAYAAAIGKARARIQNIIGGDINNLLADAYAHMLVKRVPLWDLWAWKCAQGAGYWLHYHNDVE